MAKDKKGFVLYADQKELFTELTDQEAGQLIKHIFKYVNDENPEPENREVKISFIPIKQQLKRDLKHWESVRAQRSKAGKASANKRKQNSTNPTYVESVEQNSTNPTVIDKVKVKVNDIIERFKKNNHESLFMQLNIDPKLMDQYINEFTAKLIASKQDLTNSKDVNQWWFNWLKLQPKHNLKYLTPDERLRKGLNPKREYIWSKVDNSDYAGLLNEEEKKTKGFDINQVVTLNLNVL